MKRKIKERCTYYEDIPDVWLHEEPNISIILPAKFIPDGSVVIKKTGNKEFILKSSIFIIPYSEENGEFVKKTLLKLQLTVLFFL